MPIDQCIVPADLGFGVTLWVFAFFLGGLSVAGQPQVVTRVMTLGSDKDRKTADAVVLCMADPISSHHDYNRTIKQGSFHRFRFRSRTWPPNACNGNTGALLGRPNSGLYLHGNYVNRRQSSFGMYCAFTDDVMPEISQDHKKTKAVTLGVALSPLQYPFSASMSRGNSVFSLVVLAVYGLGSIFVPILIIRWAKYEPDTTHTIAMMVAALTGVIAWRLMGLNDEVFESIPGMGAAFLTHFVMNKIRSPELSPLGRYDFPDKRKIRALAAAVIIPFGAFETAYVVSGPDSLSFDPGISGDWIVSANFDNETLADGLEYVNDGESIVINMHTDAVEGSEDFNLVGVRVTLQYSEDESSSGFGCAVPGASNPDPDTITGTISNDRINGTASGQKLRRRGLLPYSGSRVVQ